jgi:HKD family nuclease
MCKALSDNTLDQNASSQFLPRLVMNDYSTGRKTLVFILDNLTTCETSRFAVAFLTRSGVACLQFSNLNS